MSDRSSSLYEKVSKSTDLEKDFPELFRHEEFTDLKKRREWKNTVKYIILLYSKNSELIQEFQSDLASRKDAAATKAGFDRKSGGAWADHVQSLIDVSDRLTHEAIMCFLKVQNHVVWTEIVVTEQELFEFQKLRFMAIDTGDKKKNKRKKNEEGGYDNEVVNGGKNDKDIYEAAKKKDALMKACDDRIKYLESKYKEFYGDNRDVQTAEFDEVITPEIAERVIKKEKIDYEITC